MKGISHVDMWGGGKDIPFSHMDINVLGEKVLFIHCVSTLKIQITEVCEERAKVNNLE